MFDWLKKKRPSNGPDFTKIDSQEKAKQLAVEGVLSKLYLLPPEFGGDPSKRNGLNRDLFITVNVRFGSIAAI